MLTFVQAIHLEAADEALEPFPARDLKFSFLQDPVTRDAAILADNMGRNGGCRRAQRPQIFYPGRWWLGVRYDNRLEFDDGDFVRNTFLVTGLATIETPLGPFETWVAEITSQSPALGEITGVDWWAPQLGAPARFQTTTILPDGDTIHIDAMLTHSSVPSTFPSSGDGERV